MDMLQARLGKLKNSEIKTYVNDISVMQLSIFMICDFSALTNVIVMMEDATKGILIYSIFTVLLLTYLILYSSSKTIKF